MSEAVETIDEGDLRAEIHYDDDPESPREFDYNLTVMAFAHRRYDLGDAHLATLSGDLAQEVNAALAEHEFRPTPTNARAVERWLRWRYKAKVIKWVGMIDHSGQSLFTSDSPDAMGGWDSGCIGVMFDTAATRERAGMEAATGDKLRETAEEEFDAYDKYVQNDVYSYRILRMSSDDENDEDREEVEELDSCSGYFGLTQTEAYVRGLLQQQQMLDAEKNNTKEAAHAG